MRALQEMTTRRVALSLAPLAALIVAAATPQLLGRQVSSAWAQLGEASPGWLWLGVAGFLASALCIALSWRAALAAAGARISRLDVTTRYGAGCLVNSVAPGGVGDAVRVALLSRKLEGPGRLWTTGGAAAAGATLRGLAVSVLVLAAALLGALPLWPVLVLVGGGGAAAAVAWAVARRRPHGRFGLFLAGFTALARSPRAAAAVVGWALAAQASRVAAATAVAAALQVPHPLLAALVIVPTLQLATTFPLTPGNIGIATGAVALALQTRGVGVDRALATGIAYHAAETLVGVGFGAASALALIELPQLARRLAAAAATAVVAVGLGVTVLNLV